MIQQYRKIKQAENADTASLVQNVVNAVNAALGQETPDMSSQVMQNFYQCLQSV